MTTDPTKAPEPAAIVVFDIGKTNIKLTVLNRTGDVLESHSCPNRVIEGPPYRSFDLEGSEAWLINGLRDLATRHKIVAIVPCGHGSGAVLVDAEGPVMPMVDYDQDLPAGVAAAYTALDLPLDDRGGMTRPGAAHIGRQLFWLQQGWPDQAARGRHFLGLPQYWAWRLSGIAAAELTYLGAQSHLWNIPRRRRSALARQPGLLPLLPDPCPAWQPLGRIRADMAARTGLAPATLIFPGIHDSSANFYRYQAAGLRDFAVISTGSWVVMLKDCFDPGRLAGSPALSCFADIAGNPVGGTLVMGGRELQLIAPDPPATIDLQTATAELARLIAQGSMALPSFVRFDGLFPGSGGQGRIAGPEPQAALTRYALGLLYVALLTDAGLEALGAGRQIILDGPFAATPLFGGILAALRPGCPIRCSTETNGTAVGAALLAGHAARAAPVTLNLQDAAPLRLPGLETYARNWRAAAGSPSSRRRGS